MRCGFQATAFLIICGAFVAQAQDSRSGRTSQNSPAAKSPTEKRRQQRKTTPAAKRTKPLLPAKLTPQQKTDALDFAKTNHPELAELLVALKSRKPTFYDRGVRELFRTYDRLAKLQSKNPDRYESSLTMWKLDSRIRLLAARSTMSNDPVVEAELKQALRERTELRLQQLTSERDRAQLRADKLNQTINEITKDPDAAAQRDFERLKKSLRPHAPKAKKSSKKSAKPAKGALQPADGRSKGK